MRKINGRFGAVARVTALMGILAATLSVPAQAQTYRVLHSFAGGTDGQGPVGGLIRDVAGNLYGTTEAGGDPNCNRGYGCGTVFKLDRSGNETVLYSFTGGTDGEFPEDTLVRDAAGNLYGTTLDGGTYGYGTIFKLDSTGKESVLYSFSGTPDGANPVGGVIRDGAGNLYGTTSSGGDYSCQCGVVFRLGPSGKETVLHAFTGGADGANPDADLIHDSDGALYTTTFSGASAPSCGGLGCGTVVKIHRAGKETTLYSFTGATDGQNPTAGLLRDAAGNLYGTTDYGGSVSYCGTIFELDSAGAKTVLYNFTCGADGGNPYAGLVMDATGNLYGTASSYGVPSCGQFCGTVFELTATGALTVLHTFTSGTDGGWPSAGLVMDPAGNLYGTAFVGGAFNRGVVFGIKP